MATVRFIGKGMLLAGVWLLAQPALAASCSEIRASKQEDSHTFKLSDIMRCINEGKDPPSRWLPEGGQGAITPAGGGGGSSSLNFQAPDKPPAMRGFGPSVSESKMKFSMKFPPWKGFPCQIPGGTDMCKDAQTTPDGEQTGDGQSEVVDACPIASDNTGTFGTKQAVTASGSYQLACGATVPLSIYQMTLTRNPEGVVATEYNSPYLWRYRRSGNSYASAGTPVPLPSYLCRPTGPRGEMERSVELGGPHAQFHTYGISDRYIALRLLSIIPTGAEAEETETPPPLSPAHNDERYLVIPIDGGIAQVPQDCASEETYLKPASQIPGEIVIETELEPACEGTAEQCASVGASTTPSAPASCTTATIYLTGDTQETAACKDMTQMVILDRPNLLFPPASTPTFKALDGRSALMVGSSEGSKLYLPSGNTLRLQRSGQRYTLDEGGILGLSNGRLYMYGPATIDTGAGQAILTAGGEFIDDAGNSVAKYNANSVVPLTGGYPLLISAEKNITLPAGYDIPTQPSPYIRAPLATP